MMKMMMTILMTMVQTMMVMMMAMIMGMMMVMIMMRMKLRKTKTTPKQTCDWKRLIQEKVLELSSIAVYCVQNPLYREAKVE
jgi:uncharacterized membrane protein